MPATRSVATIDAADEPEYRDGADGYALETIMHSGDGRAITYDDLIMLPGFIDFGVADVRGRCCVGRNANASYVKE